jgi:hypothetical protein
VLEANAGAMPRTLNLVTGASRTGDIGGKIVMGAHGPRRLGRDPHRKLTCDCYLPRSSSACTG